MPLKTKYLIGLLLSVSLISQSQDPQFSQFYANQLYLAPSFAGATEDYRVAINWRNQWPSIPGVFHTYSVSFDKAIPNFNSGIGILATHDVAGSGDLSTTNIGLLYSYDIQVNEEWHIRPGINFKFTYLGLDLTKLVWNSQITTGGTLPPITPPPFDNVADIDFTVSGLAYSEKIWGGFTVDHLLRPRTSFWGDNTSVPIKVDLFGGFQIVSRGRLRTKLTEVLSVAGNVMFQADFFQSDIGFYYFKNPLVFGVWYRGIPFATSKDVSSQAGDAIIGMLGIKTDQLNIGLSYDFTISNLITTSGGAYEISLIYSFASSQGKRGGRIHAIPCPEF
ncbi:MAG: PorP/SprF family type IX secretion system membrane protein [Bacteroidales bacterium]|nr:PorP/SprF family type IX secretion system membrane protein [Bacteroidales bacterium]